MLTHTFLPTNAHLNDEMPRRQNDCIILKVLGDFINMPFCQHAILSTQKCAVFTLNFTCNLQNEANKLSRYITLDWKGLQGTNTLDY